MELSGEEIRVLGCLIEKSHTTPDQYPLSTNSLRLACNQKTSRHPIVNYSAQQVDSVILELRDRKLARSIHSRGNRGFKHRHVVDERLGLDDGRQAVLSVLMLRGPQSARELASRTERYRNVGDVDAVELILAELAKAALVGNIGRGSGQSQDRWAHRLGNVDHAVDAGLAQPSDEIVSRSLDGADGGGPDIASLDRPRAAITNSGGDLVAHLIERVDELERRVAKLERG